MPAVSRQPSAVSPQPSAGGVRPAPAEEFGEASARGGDDHTVLGPQHVAGVEVPEQLRPLTVLVRRGEVGPARGGGRRVEGEDPPRSRAERLGDGAGVVVEATRRVSEWALHDLGLHRLRLCHSVANPASCRVAEKAGFSLEGTMCSALLHADGWHDEHLHALVRCDI